MAAQDSLRNERRRPRQYFWGRPQPAAPFTVLRKHRRGYLPESTPRHQGQVYVASCDGLEPGIYKIGKSTDHFSKRSQALSQPTGVPGYYFPLYRLETDSFDEIERRALYDLQSFRLHRRKEFLLCPLEEIIKTLQRLQRETAPFQAFSEHYYFGIEEFEEELAELYRSFLRHTGPEEWPRICIFLSLASGHPPRDLLIRLQSGDTCMPLALQGLPQIAHTSWLAEYLRSLMYHEYLPYGRELDWLWPCSHCKQLGGEDPRSCLLESDESLEECERWDWFYKQWEDFLWEGIESLPLLRKIQSFLLLDSPSLLCQVLYQKAKEYGEGRRSPNEGALGSTSVRRDFHFI